MQLSAAALSLEDRMAHKGSPEAPRARLPLAEATLRGSCLHAGDEQRLGPRASPGGVPVAPGIMRGGALGAALLLKARRQKHKHDNIKSFGQEVKYQEICTVEPPYASRYLK